MNDIQTFTWNELAVSPLNIRFNEEDCAAVAPLAASIVENGLLEPLLLHTIEGEPAWAKVGDYTNYARFGIYAGGRRYRAIRFAIQSGTLPPDFPIAARVKDQDEGSILLDSLDENIQRRDIRPYEVARAIARAVNAGKSIADIAARGQSERWVLQQLRLGNLAEPVFDALAAGEIDLDQARAFGATDDPELQRVAWQHFRPLRDYERRPDNIRAYLKVGDRELSRLLLFVGEAVYRGRGGRFELDLFAAEKQDRGRIVDETLLRELSEERMAGIRDELRGKLGERELRFQAAPPQFAGHTDHALEIHDVEKKGGRVSLGRYPVGDVVATIDIDAEGRWSARYWWASRKAKGEFERARTAKTGSSAAREAALTPTAGEALEQPEGSYSSAAHQIVRDEHGLTKDGLQVIRSQRRDLLRGLLLRNAANLGGESVGRIARDYLTWAQLRAELGRDRDTATGARKLAPEDWAISRDAEPRDIVKPYLAAQLVHDLWHDELARLQKCDFMTIEDPGEALRAYLVAEDGEKALAEAVLAGLALLRSANTPGWQIPVHDVLAEALDGRDEVLRLFWEPDHQFTGLFGKLARLALAQPYVEEAAFRNWSKLKDKPLAAAVAAALQGLQGGSAASFARKWVHPLLTFGVGGRQRGNPPLSAQAPQELEAAE